MSLFIILQFACSIKHTKQVNEEEKQYRSSYTVDYEFCDASTTGTLKGIIIDASNEKPIKECAYVVLKGTTIGTASDAKGDYLIEGIPPDTYDVWIPCMGYQDIMARDIKIKAGQITILNVKLAPSRPYPLPKEWGIY